MELAELFRSHLPWPHRSDDGDQSIRLHFPLSKFLTFPPSTCLLREQRLNGSDKARSLLSNPDFSREGSGRGAASIDPVHAEKRDSRTGSRRRL